MENTENELETNPIEQETLTGDPTENSAEAADSGPENPTTALEKAQAEAADWKDKYIRLYAEFENYRHRTSREKLALVGTATEGLMKDLLPVVDDFERSLKAMETAQDVGSLKEGVDLVYQKFLKVLIQKGLKPMEAIGKDFDAEFHEAITQIPAPGPEMKGKVVDEVEKGYSLQDKTIRFAKVVIGS